MRILHKIFAVLIIASFAFGMTGCNKEKALKTVRDAENLAAKLLIYGNAIAKANNDSFRAGNIPANVHLATNIAIDKYAKGVDAFIAGIDAAKKGIAAGEKPDGQIDILQALFNSQVANAALAMISAVSALPLDVRDKIAGWVAAIELAIASFRALFAETRQILNAGVNNYA